MLECGNLVVTLPDRLIDALHNRAALGGKVGVVEGGLELLLEIVLAALDLVDDRFLVATHDGRLKIDEALVGLAEERAVVLGIAAKTADFCAKLLDHAAGLVRPGGLLVYCTCSLEPEEGEAQVAAFLARDPRYARVPVRPEEVGGAAALIDDRGDLRTLPCHLPELEGARGGLDGFFASRLRRAD